MGGNGCINIWGQRRCGRRNYRSKIYARSNVTPVRFLEPVPRPAGTGEVLD